MREILMNTRIFDVVAGLMQEKKIFLGGSREISNTSLGRAGELDPSVVFMY